MNLVLRSAAAAVLAAAALTPPAALAQQQYSVDFNWAPDQPTLTEKTTLRASTTAPDVNWDLDSDGDIDARGPVVEHQFATAGTHRVTVKASWPGAAPIERSATRSIIVQGNAIPTPTPTVTATPEPVVTPAATPVVTPAPTCPTTITFGKLVATSACFVDGASTTPVKLNGLTLTPLAGKAIIVQSSARLGTRVQSENARVTLTAKGAQLTAYTGKLDLKLVGDQLQNFKVTPGVKLAGLKLSGTPKLNLLTGGKAQLVTAFALPSSLGGQKSTQPVAVTPGSSDPVTFTVSNGGINGVNLTGITVKLEGEGTWRLDAKLQIPQPLGLKVAGGLVVKNGDFTQFYSSTSLGSKHGPVHLKRLDFALEKNAAKSKCHAPGAFVAMCGDLSLTAGPTLLGAPALSLDGGFGLNSFSDKGTSLKAYGKVKLVGMTLADATFEMRDTGYVGVKSKMSIGWPGIATIKGNASVEFQGLKFNGESSDKVCLEFVDYCLGAQTLLSTKGLAACLNIDVWGYAWHPGIGVKWGKTPDLYWSGCDLAPYREAFASAAAARDRTVRLPAGLPGAAIAVKGAQRVLLIGPKGERIETAADRVTADKRFFAVPAPGLVQIAIRQPSAGTWKVRALEGSITSVKSAQGLAAPSVKGKLRKGKLTYRVKRIPGQVVRFTQNGRTLGTAHGAKGTLRVKGKGPVVALVEQNGQLRDRVTLK